jgi:hypothetical protein
MKIYGAGKTFDPSNFENVFVTTLEDGDYEGTLRYAIKKGGNVIFKVGGVFELKGNDIYPVKNILIKGETAPYPGVTITGESAIVDYGNCDNFSIRHVRFRPTYTGTKKKDILGLRSSLIAVSNVSFFGNHLIDEAISIRDGGEEITDITVQHCLIMATMGGIMGSDGGSYEDDRSHFKGNFTSYANVYSHTSHRFPNVAGAGAYDVINNLAHNYRYRGMRVLYDVNLNFAHNIYIPGIASGSRLHCKSVGNPKIYLFDNVVEGSTKTEYEQWTIFDTSNLVETSVFVESEAFPMHDNYPIYNESELLEKAGANLITNSNGELVFYRDVIDEKIINDIRNRKSVNYSEINWILPTNQFPPLYDETIYTTGEFEKTGGTRYYVIINGETMPGYSLDDFNAFEKGVEEAKKRGLRNFIISRSDINIELK